MFLEMLTEFIRTMGIAYITWEECILVILGVLLIYIVIKREMEPMLLIPIAFGMILVNLPETSINNIGTETIKGGFLWYMSKGLSSGIYIPLVFLGIGCRIDFSTLLANPKLAILGIINQVGIVVSLVIATILGFTGPEAASISMLGGTTGLASVHLASEMYLNILPQLAIIGFIYKEISKTIQPTLIKALVPESKRNIVMAKAKIASKRERIVFPILVMVVVSIFIPKITPIIGMLMLGNLLREYTATQELSINIGENFSNIILVFLGLSIGTKATPENLFEVSTISIFIIGGICLIVSTVVSLLIGNKISDRSNGSINPLISCSGFSLEPFGAKVSYIESIKDGIEKNIYEYAVGVNSASIITSIIFMGILLDLFV